MVLRCLQDGFLGHVHEYLGLLDRGLYHFRGQWAHLKTSTAGIRKNAEAELEEIRELDGATGTDIENLLVGIAEHTRAKPEKFYGIRHFFDGCVEVERQTRIYEIVARFAGKPTRAPIRATVLCVEAT